jgi:hypothetical protein
MSKLPFDPNNFNLIPIEPIDTIVDVIDHDGNEGVGISLDNDWNGLDKLSAFVNLSRSHSVLVSNEVMNDYGNRTMFAWVRKLDGNLTMAAIAMAEDITRKAVVKILKAAGVTVKSVNGVGAPEVVRVQ